MVQNRFDQKKLRPKLLKSILIQASLKRLKRKNVMVSFQRDFHIWMDDLCEI